MLFRAATRLSVRVFSVRNIHEIPVVSGNEFDPHHFHLENKKNHDLLGPIYRQEIGPGTNLVFVSHPDLFETIFRKEGLSPKFFLPVAWKVYCQHYGVKRGILFEEGEEWRRMRRKLNPLFLRESQYYADYLTEVSKETIDLMTRHVNRNKKVSVESLVDRWSIGNVLGALFGERYWLHSDQLIEQIDQIVCMNKIMLESSAKLQMFDAEEECRNETDLWTEFKTSADKMLDVSHKVSRKLLHSKFNGIANKMYKEKKFTSAEIHRLTKDLIIAASDTTAITTMWCLYLLAGNKKEQENIRWKLHPLTWSLKEALRLFPVAPFLTRITANPIKLSDRVELPKGTGILLSLYSVGRDPSYFENPDEFQPRRWDRVLKRPVVGRGFSHLPFGFGVRSCLGKVIADYGMQVFIGSIVEKFELSRTEDVKYIMKLIGLPDRPMNLTLKKKLRSK